MIGGNVYEQHYSSLDQVNATTVSGLKLEWYADLPTKDGLTGVPIVVNGVVYDSGGMGKAWAHDARTGRKIWEFDANMQFPLGVVPSWGARMSRGLAVWGDRVLKATGDCRLIALDRKTGAIAWQAQTCDSSSGRTITGAPRVGDGKVFIGNADADSGAGRPHVDAYDIATGRHLWRFYTIPGDPSKGFESPAMELASKTWGPEYWKKSAGGSPWEGITYDPRTKLVYIGTDAPVPANPALRGNPSGDELFTNAIVALKADTGEYVWHYTTTPQDGWNYASVFPVILADMKINGKRQHVLMNAPKNGFFYVHDARTGALLNEPKPIVDVNWARSIDFKTGRPIYNSEAQWWTRGEEGAVVSPSGMGARNWMPMSFNPGTGLVYIPVTDYPSRIWENRDKAMGHAEGDQYWSLTHGGRFKGELLAWDPIAQKERWRRVIGRPYQGGTLTTRGNIVFQGSTRGTFAAYRADTGEKLWEYPTVSGVLGAPSTALIDNKQMIFVAVGSGSTAAVGYAPQFSDRADGPARLLAFSLTGSAALPPSDRQSTSVPKPTSPEPDEELAKRGKNVWDSAGCELCHGIHAIGGTGSLPDLRRSADMQSAALSAIVRNGVFKEQGMPVFDQIVQESDIEALQAYIRQQAWLGYRESASTQAGP
jgi:quinohemoprotein ethanol dehydrogenase